MRQKPDPLNWIPPNPLRIYPSALDGWEYQRTRDDASEETLAEYVRDLTGQTPPNAQMERGTRFHKALEEAAATGHWGCDDIGWAHGLHVQLARPRIVEGRMLRFRKVGEFGLDADGIDHLVLSGRADAEIGFGDCIVDYKTTEKVIQIEKYADSWQWRAYLHMWEAKKFRYEVFRLMQDRASPCWKVVEHRSIEMTPYAAMVDEVWRKAAEFARFIVALRDEGRLRIDKDGRLKPAQ